MPSIHSFIRTPQLLLMLVIVGAVAAAATTATTNDSSNQNESAFGDSSKSVTVNHLGEHNACCRGTNVFTGTGGCLDGDHPHMTQRMNCSRYMLDPASSELDEFRATAQGLQNGKTMHENNQFCHAWIPDAENDSQLHQVALVCFEEISDSYHTLFLVKGVLAMVSVLFLLATLYVYYLIPDLRETQDKVTCVALVCLILFLLCLGTIQIANPSNLALLCVPLGAMVYFFVIAYFTWLNVIMWNVWKSSTMARWKIKERHWYWLNHAYGWFVPLALSLLLFSYSDDHFSTESCYLHIHSSAYFMYIPMSVMLSMNVVLFIWSAWGIHATGQDISPDKRRALTYKFCLYLRLITLAGITWILEVLSYFYNDINHDWNIWLIVDIVNVLHGLGVFVVLVVCRRRIRQELANKRILCFRTPASWATEKDSEERGLHADEKEPYDLINVRSDESADAADR